MYAQAPVMAGPATSQTVVNHGLATVVYGVSIEDPAVAAKVKRVMTIAVACLSMGVIYNLGQLVNGAPVMSALIGLAFVWMIPACGYFGAKQKDKNLLCCFWGCNLCNAICIAIVFAWTCILLAALSTLDMELAGIENKCCGDMVKGDHFPTADQMPYTCKGDHLVSNEGKMNAVTILGHSSCDAQYSGNCLQMPTADIICCYTKADCSTQLAVSQQFIGNGGGFIYLACVCLFVQMCLGAHFLPPTLPLPRPHCQQLTWPHPRLAHHTHVCMLINCWRWVFAAGISCFLGCSLWKEPFFNGNATTAVSVMSQQQVRNGCLYASKCSGSTSLLMLCSAPSAATMLQQFAVQPVQPMAPVQPMVPYQPPVMAANTASG
jgi:hypothetical protein